MTPPEPTKPPAKPGTLQRIADRVRWYSGALRAEFDRLYTRAVGLAKSAAQARRMQEADAEDLAARICEDLPAAFAGGVVSSDDEESLAKWVKRRVLNTFSHAQRAKIRRGARSEGFATAMQDYEGAWMNPHSQAELGEMRSKLMAAASQLSPLRQQVFLQLYEGRPQQEIAAKLGVQYQTVRKHASEIYALLREAMASYREDWRPSKPSWYSTEPAAPEAK